MIYLPRYRDYWSHTSPLFTKDPPFEVNNEFAEIYIVILLLMSQNIEANETCLNYCQGTNGIVSRFEA